MLRRLNIAFGTLLLVTGAAGISVAEEPERLAGHGGPVMAVRLSDDGSEALTASFDYSVIHWAMKGKEGEILHRMDGHEAAVNDVAFVPGARLAVSVSDDGSLAIWNLEDGEMTARIESGGEKAIDVDVAPDGSVAAAARWDATVRLYDIAGVKEVARLEGHRGNVNAVVFASNGKMLYSASYDGTIRVWPLLNGMPAEESRVIHSHGWGVNVLERVPAPERLAFGATDGAFGLIDLETGEAFMLDLGEDPLVSLAVSPDGAHVAAGSANGSIWVIDAANGAVVEEYDNIHGPVWDMAFSHDGRTLFHGGLDDFVASWKVDPRQVVEPVKTVFPRRFQVSEGADPGEAEFQRKCSVCHTLEPDGANRAGPTLHGLFGRKAGSVKGYSYSPALANSEIVWTEKTVAMLFDLGPDVFTPGSKMPVQVLTSVERRDALINYLKLATMPDGGPGNEEGADEAKGSDKRP